MEQKIEGYRTMRKTGRGEEGGRRRRVEGRRKRGRVKMHEQHVADDDGGGNASDATVAGGAGKAVRAAEPGGQPARARMAYEADKGDAVVACRRVCRASNGGHAAKEITREEAHRWLGRPPVGAKRSTHACTGKKGGPPARSGTWPWL